MRIKPIKNLGQNFLINDNISKKIVALASITSKCTILEVGSGKHALTKFICKDNPKKFIVVEYDNFLHSLNLNLFKNTNYKSVNMDINKFDESKYFDEKITIISNLPYNISNTLLIKWIKLQASTNKVKKMILMFQKELAERIISNINNKKYGRISVISKAFFEVNIKINVGKNNFFPKPKVDSCVLEFNPLKKATIDFKDIVKLEKITNFFFNSRRKKNKKKIKQLFSEEQIEKYRFHTYYDLRPENIPTDIYHLMAKII